MQSNINNLELLDDNQNYSKELETYKRIPIRLGTDALEKENQKKNH